MAIGTKLKQIIDDKGIKPSELAMMVDLPAQTIYSLISRDSNKVSIDALLKICSVLQISVEELYLYDLQDNAKKSILNDNQNFALSDHEKEMVMAYRQSAKNMRDGIDRILGIDPESTSKKPRK